MCVVGAHQLFASSISVSDKEISFGGSAAQADAAQGKHYNGFPLVNSQGAQQGIVVVDAYKKTYSVTDTSINFLVTVGSDYTGNFNFNVIITSPDGTQQTYPLSVMSNTHYVNGASYHFVVRVTDLDPSTQYNFQFVESTTNSSGAVFSETTEATNQQTPANPQTNGGQTTTTTTTPPAATATGFSATTSQTPTSFTVKYHYVGIPTETMKLYSWLGVANSSTWIDRSNLLITIPAKSTQVTQDFSATYDFNALGLTGNGTKYVYYLSTGTTDNDTLLAGPGYFTVGTAPTPEFDFSPSGQVAGTAPGTYQETFTLKSKKTLTDPVTLSLEIVKQSDPTTIVISEPPFPISGSGTASPGTDDLPPGEYTANLIMDKVNVGKADFTLVTAFDAFNLDISHIFAPDTSVTIDGVITANRGVDVPDGHLVLKVGKNPSLLDTAETAFSGTIPITGVPFKVTIDSLDPSIQTQYYYKFTETTTGTDLKTGSFVLNTPGDQAENQGPHIAGPATPTDATTSSDATTASSDTTTTSTDTTPSASDPKSYLANPLNPALNTFPKILAAVMNNIVLPIMIPFISIMLIYCGFLFVVARKKGSTDGYAAAKKTLMYTIIGAALVLGATVVSNALQGTLNDILGPSGSSTTTTTTQ